MSRLVITSEHFVTSLGFLLEPIFRNPGRIVYRFEHDEVIGSAPCIHVILTPHNFVLQLIPGKHFTEKKMAPHDIDH